MTSTISAPAVRGAARERRRQLRIARPPEAAARTAPAAGADKLAVPRPSLPLLHRRRVTELIAHAATHRVTLVCAQAGAGKTVACALWAAERPAAEVAWLSLDPADRVRGQFWQDVRAALARAAAPGDDVTAGLPGTPGLPDPGDETFPARLLAAAERLPAPVTLVLDDICTLAESDALSGLHYLVRHGPPTVRLVLCGRHPAGLQVARLRVAGDLAEVGDTDLACTPQEADSYFAMLGIALPPDRREELLARTQGWMTGLRLAAMRHEPRASAAGRISGADPAVADYLRDEVLAAVPPGTRLFLMRTAVADVICGDLADALTGGTSGAAVLDQLSRQITMVRPERTQARWPDGTWPDGTWPHGPEGTSYRYHPLLLDLLRAQLRRELPGELPLLARKAARWQAAHGRPADAIRNAAQAGDWDFAVRVLADVGPIMLLPGPAAELEPVLAIFPPGRFTADASVAAALAASGLRTGDYCAAALHLRNARQGLDRCPAGQRRTIATWLQALELMLAASQGGAEAGLAEQAAATAASAQARACGAADHQAAGLLLSALGVAALARLEVVSARDAFGQACRQLRGGGQPEFGARAHGWQALAHAMYGDLLGASTLLGELAGHGAAASDPVAVSLAGLASAWLHWARDEAAAARRALDACEPGGGPRYLPEEQVLHALVTTARARMALGDGDHGTARSLLTRLRYESLSLRASPGHGPHPRQGEAGQNGRNGATALDRALAPLDAEIAVRDADPSRAKLTLSRCGTGPSADDAALALARARVMLAEGDSRGALGAVQPCLGEETGRTAGPLSLHDQVCALVTAAVSHRRLGQSEPAAAHLTSALALAEPQDLYRPFLDGAAPARSALTVLIRPGGQGAAFAARILQRFDACPGRLADTTAATPVPLTTSELAVLRFLPSHMTNQEIAEALFLSINTVKTHLRSAYRKLGVTTRRQAISRGGRLGLL